MRRVTLTRANGPLASWVGQVVGAIQAGGRAMVFTTGARDAEAVHRALTHEGYTVMAGGALLEVSDDLAVGNVRRCA